MRVLLVNKFWYSQGGSERYSFLLSNLLESRGHEVIPFAMVDERNLPTPWAKHFAPHIDFWKSGESDAHASSAFAKLSKVLWNRAAAAKLDALLTEVKPDVAHLQNFAHQLSPSILPVLARHQIPIVWTLHDYKLLCPNYRMYTQGLPCERCKGHSYANAIRYNCMGARGASAAVALEMALHHVLTNVYGEHLDVVIAPSTFLAGKLREWEWTGRVEVVPNFVGAIGEQRVGERAIGRVLFVGRLIEEKGIEDFVEAARGLRGIPCAIIGDGPLHARFPIVDSTCSHIEWLGALPPGATGAAIARAAMLVVPSRWYENAPYVILEAMAAGVPVIATRIGGLPELVRDGETGILVPPRDPVALARAIQTLYDAPSRARAMGERAQVIARTEYSPERHYEQLMEIYASAVHGRAATSTGR